MQRNALAKFKEVATKHRGGGPPRGPRGICRWGSREGPVEPGLPCVTFWNYPRPTCLSARVPPSRMWGFHFSSYASMCATSTHVHYTKYAHVFYENAYGATGGSVGDAPASAPAMSPGSWGGVLRPAPWAAGSLLLPPPPPLLPQRLCVLSLCSLTLKQIKS